MRILAVVVLCSLAAAQQDRSARALVAQLHSRYADERATAEEQLVQLGSAGVPILIAVLRDQTAIDDADAAVRATRAARVLARLGSDARDALPALDTAIASAAEAIDASVPDGIEPGGVALTGAPIPEALRVFHCELLRARTFVASAARVATEELIADLTASDPFARERAASLLGQRGAEAKSAIPTLLAGMRQCHSGYRVRTGPRFYRMLWCDAVIRGACVGALLAIAPDSPDVRSAYIALLRDDDPVLRRKAVMALGRLGPDVPSNAYFLRPILADADPLVVREAITALGMLGAAAAAAAADLERLRHSPDRQIAVRAEAALRQIRSR